METLRSVLPGLRAPPTPTASRLVETLHERGRPLFTLDDAVAATGLGAASARSLVHKLVGRALATRLRPGLFILV